MSITISLENHVEQWLSDDLPSNLRLTSLADEVAKEVVEQLKKAADQYWYIDPNRSLEFASRIMAIGQARDDPQQTALGYMAMGDALKFLGRIPEAWNMLDQAGRIFQVAGDEVGWARTRIGRLYLAVKLNHVQETLLDAGAARKVFIRHSAYDFLVRLNMARAVVYGSLGNVRRALRLLYVALTVAETLETNGQQHLGQLYLNIGVAHEVLGDFSNALIYYERARSLFIARNETRNIAIIEINIAYIAQAQGQYRHSLNLLHGILRRGVVQFPMEYLAIKRDMTECYLYLNRFSEASELAKEVVAGYKNYGAVYEIARSLLHHATAEAEFGNFTIAHTIFQEAEQYFANLGATSWQALTCLRRGRTALKQGDPTGATQDALAALADFKLRGQKVNYAAASMLLAQALFASEEFQRAIETGTDALHIAQQYSVPSLSYSGHLLLGQIAECQGNFSRAVRRYQAAGATVERVQRGLTITLRPGFLEDKNEAERALIALYLRTGQSAKAFETVEHTKSQVLLGYILNCDFLHWEYDTPYTRALLTELGALRAEHQWFYRLAHDLPRNSERSTSVSLEEALSEIAIRERRMRAITEQLYLSSGHNQQENLVPFTSLRDIQFTLKPDVTLIEFYSDGTHIWAFVVDQRSIETRSLPLEIDTLREMLGQLQTNVGAALRVASQTTAGHSLTRFAQRILERLYSTLIKPLGLDRPDLQRLVIVPYGVLHYLPFHLLYDGSKYLIEKHEVVIMPTASLATRAAPKRKPGALVLAHSFEEGLPYAVAEAHEVQQMMGGDLYVEEEARREILHATPVQVLHIAAHGQHRLDQPELSYVHLADGQMYADDLLQQDLSYELVTLSACETGRAQAVASDELIGLGRGFLYAGAGALVVSLWRVADDSALDFMRRMYTCLAIDKKSKAAAMREAQQSILEEDRNVHPAFWGAFQLMGNADPLSTLVE